jgi:tRNA pseudouridine38-40 synthase
MSQRFAGCVEYRGSRYHGWQRQHHAVSVQEMVEKAIGRIANETISISPAGRTDTGVHGIGQIFHFDSSAIRKEFEWLRGINTYLPNDISLHWVRPVPDEFHARYCALSRSYRYVILNRRVSPGYLDGLVTWHRETLNIQLMQEGCRYFLGKHDFSAFRSSKCQNKNPVKTVTRIDIDQSKDWIWLDITANGFLHHMVRNIAGTLLEIGIGEQKPEWVSELLMSEDRSKAGVTAPADGLYFTNVIYDEKYDLPEPPDICRFW